MGENQQLFLRNTLFLFILPWNHLEYQRSWKIVSFFEYWKKLWQSTGRKSAQPVLSLTLVGKDVKFVIICYELMVWTIWTTEYKKTISYFLVFDAFDIRYLSAFFDSLDTIQEKTDFFTLDYLSCQVRSQSSNAAQFFLHVSNLLLLFFLRQILLKLSSFQFPICHRFVLYDFRYFDELATAIVPLEFFILSCEIFEGCLNSFECCQIS